MGGGEAIFLPEDQATKLHHMVAQLILLSTRVFYDIQTYKAFLTTWVKNPDEDDRG